MDYQIRLPESVKNIIETLKEAGFPTYVVGGSIRDSLMNRPVYDWDFATKASPEEILTIFPNGKYENDFGTVLIPIQQSDKVDPLKGWTLPSTTPFEITPFRSESTYSDNRHPDQVQWAETIETDLQRRDFTINALAYDGASLIDTTGGVSDLNNKLIRAVGDPNKRFQEDALRMLRAIRFSAQLQFTIEEGTLNAITDNADLIRSISWERIRDELMKTFSVSNPSHAADAILIMRNTGLLAKILPELNRCFLIEQVSPERHHTQDVGTHLIETLRHCPSHNPIVRWACLLHDIGKAETRAIDPKTGIVTFYNHEIVGTTVANAIAERLRFSKSDRILLTKLVRYHMFSVEDHQTDKAIRRFIRRVGKEHIQDMLDLRTADRIGSGAKETSWRTELFKHRIEEVQKKPFEIRDLTINGQDVMDVLQITPGPTIGLVLSNLFEKVADGELPNERDILLKQIPLVELDKQPISPEKEDSELIHEKQ